MNKSNLGSFFGYSSYSIRLIYRLYRKHPELEYLKIKESQCGNRGYKAMLASPMMYTLHLNQSWSLYEVHDSYDFKECTEPDCDYDSDDGCDCGDEAEFDYDEDLVLRCDDCHLKHRDRIRHFKPRRLQNLDLTSCTFTNSDFLKFLHFIGCVKSGYQASMKSLHLDRTEVTFDDLLPATSLSLQSLSIEGRHLSETGITFFLKVVAKNLTTLNLGETNISFSGFINNADNPVFTSLKDVNLSGCKQVTDEGLSSFLSVTREKLETLDLSKTAITLSTIGSVIFYSGVIIRAGESEPGVFGSLEPEPLEKKNKKPEPFGKKVRSRSR